MVSTNYLLLFLLEHDLNKVCNRNIHSIQEPMYSDKPARSKFKWVCTDFPNLAILTNSVTPGEVQVAYAHVSVGDKSLRETVVSFVLEGSLEATTVVLINAEHAFSDAGKNIHLPTTEFILCTAAKTSPSPRSSATGRK